MTTDFDWRAFAAKAEKLIKFASASTSSPINADRWEEIIFHILKSMGQRYKGGDPLWTVGSHAPGADIWTDHFAISAKAGNITKGMLNISSYRLTSFPDLEAKKGFIDGPGKNFDFYLCCARTENTTSRTYKIFKIPADVFLARELTWNEVYASNGSGSLKGWRGVNDRGVVVDIVKNMSDQLWIHLPLAVCEQLLEVKISNGEQGIALQKALSGEELDLNRIG